jgi:hypothetical protein
VRTIYLTNILFDKNQCERLRRTFEIILKCIVAKQSVNWLRTEFNDEFFYESYNAPSVAIKARNILTTEFVTRQCK